MEDDRVIASPTDTPDGDPDAAAEAREASRLEALHLFGVCDPEPEQSFDDVSRLAAQLCSTPMAGVSLVDGDRQWFTSQWCIPVLQTPRETSFCTHALGSHEPLVVPDLREDDRFAHLPQVTHPTYGVRFYAGAPLITRDGHVLGTLCVFDIVPRELTSRQLEQLQALARQVIIQLELRRHAARLASEVTARESAEAELRDSRRVLDGVLAHAGVGIFAMDRAGRCLLANTAVHRLTQLPEGELLGRTHTELFPPDAAADYTAHDAQVWATGLRTSFSERVVHPGGDLHTYLAVKFPLYDDADQMYAVAGVSTDITELVEERRARAESEQRWRALVEHSPASIAVVAVDGRFLYANPPALALVGASTEQEVIGLPVTTLTPPDLIDKVVTAMRSVLRTGTPLIAQRGTLRRLDGGLVPVDVSVVPVTHLGEPALQIEMRDTSAHAAAELALRAQTEALRFSEQCFRATFTHNPAGLAVLSPRGRVLQVNAALCALLQQSERELLDLPDLRTLTSPQDQETFTALAASALARTGATTSSEHSVTLVDGRLLWLVVTLTPLDDPRAGACLLLQAEETAAPRTAELRLSS